MKRVPLLFCAALTWACAALPVTNWDEVRSELARRVEEDQRLRNQFTSGEASIDLVHKIEATDRENTAWIRGVIERSGWPVSSRVGQEGAGNAWLLVQHADQDVDFQERCLELLRSAVANKEASPKHLAYLEDRVAMHRQRPQRYGTQFVGGANGFEPYTLEDPARVDEWRAEVGLGTLAEYAKLVKGE
jgi:hypothetical protein